MNPISRLTLEEKLNAMSGLLHALVQYMRQTNPQDPTLAAIEDAASDLDHTFVTAPTTREDMEQIVLDELLRGDHSFGYPLSASGLDELPNLKAALSDKPRLMSLRGMVRIAGRLRARGYPFVEGFMAGLLHERPKEPEKKDESVLRVVPDGEAAAS